LLPPWQVRKGQALALAGLAAGAVFGYFLPFGWGMPFDHGRWVLRVPGFLFAPVMSAMTGLIVWRICRERLVAYEENPTSRCIHVIYEWAYKHILRHKSAFALLLVGMAATGYLTGLGWARLLEAARGLLAGL
jgi:hypothetical protein